MQPVLQRMTIIFISGTMTSVEKGTDGFASQICDSAALLPLWRMPNMFFQCLVESKIGGAKILWFRCRISPEVFMESLETYLKR